MKRDKKRRKVFIFVSFLISMVALSLYASALATPGWFEADCIKTDIEGSTCNIHMGLWDGKLEKTQFSSSSDDLKIVCVEGECMWSCGIAKKDREAQFAAVKDGRASDFDTATRCDDSSSVAKFFVKNAFSPLFSAEDILHSVGAKSLPVLEVAKSFNIEEDIRAGTDETAEPTDPTDISTVTSMVQEHPEFMDQGLWLATIVCLCFAMLWAIVGALFAVINTATTPVEWITGVGGLYVWNILAVIFNVICVSCWAAQFHLHLVSNVLLYDSDANWTTEGMEKFGYSYWLVVVAIFIHIANIIIIYTGTYEPKKKQQLEAPDTKAGNIMLY
ncbi:unnamed protein product [Meganyctiphanes norvegica]|uniref:Clarin-3 n=1 Tax=Meganyctiphanes norvegica TaxID=48144 RepID=A0AAV2PKL0_MEGNR